jgi:alkaline phosphatase
MDGTFVTDTGNGWRIYSLNCGNQPFGGPDCSAGSTVLTWLANDMAAHPTDRFGAYFHYPQYTGYTAEGYLPDMSAVWNTLLAGGADWIINGHVHNYERFDKMDASGNVSPSGIR